MMNPSTDAFALFSLVALNGRAQDVVNYHENEYLTTTLSDGETAIGIRLRASRNTPRTLATFGRSANADIVVPGSTISRIQCSFELDLETGIVMFCDLSQNCTSQVLGDYATPFESGRPRRVVVRPTINTVIGMGGKNGDSVLFGLIWSTDYKEIAITIEKSRLSSCASIDIPRLALTVDGAATDVPSQQTRVHTPSAHSLKVRYQSLKVLGTGQFGVVHEALDLDTGKIIAVKMIRRKTIPDKDQWETSSLHALKREIEALSRIRHPNIVDYIASQNWHELKVEIFMGCKDGTLEQLVQSGAEPTTIAPVAFQHLLQALDCLACVDIIHRDVKPANVLYTRQPNGDYIFQLGDFGLCNRTIDAATMVGPPVFMAPEWFSSEMPTTKADVWSVFVTMIWILNVNEFRGINFRNLRQVYDTIASASNAHVLSQNKEMATRDPEKRASAAQMLVKLFGGKGLSTPRHLIPDLLTIP